MGPWRAWIRDDHHLVPARRGPVHRLHVHRRASADLRGRRGRVLRRSLHGHRVPDRVRVRAPAVVGIAGAWLRHPADFVGGSSSSTFVKDLPLLIAFLLLAAFTYLSGLRAPALIAFVKDLLIYVMIIVAVSYIPGKLGGWGHIFSTAGTHLATTNPKTGKPFGGLTIAPAGEWAYATLALGSALALFMYPHAVTGVLAAKRRNVIRRNMAILPAYSLVLGLVALLGYMALAAPGVPAAVKANGANAQLAVPFLFQQMFPPWFTGIAYSAIAIGALVPAAIMSIAAANLFTRNIY